METKTPIKNGWTQHKIKDFGAVSTGTTPSTKNPNYYGGPYKLISPSDLTDSKYIFTAHKFITQQGLTVARTLPKNAVLVGCIGNVGKIGITTDEISAFNQQINAIVCNANYNADFVYYLLRYQRPLLESKAAKVTLPILNKNNFENIEFEVPDLPEQKSIARVLTVVQDAISGQEELIAKLKELKRGMMQYLFTHGTKSEKTKITELGEMPESWEIHNLGDYELDIGDGNYSTKYPKQNEFIEKGVPFIRANNFDDGKITWVDMRFISPELHKEITKGHLKSGDVLIVTRGDIGKTAIVTKEFVGANINAQIVRLNGRDVFDQKYLFYLLNYSPILNQVLGLKTGTALQQLPIGKLKFVPLIHTAIDEQRTIGEHLSAIDERIFVIQEKLAAYQNLFKTLLHELMNGERRVQLSNNNL